MTFVRPSVFVHHLTVFLLLWDVEFLGEGATPPCAKISFLLATSPSSSPLASCTSTPSDPESQLPPLSVHALPRGHTPFVLIS